MRLSVESVDCLSSSLITNNIFIEIMNQVPYSFFCDRSRQPLKHNLKVFVYDIP